jgi:hypothetical protein
MSPENQGVFQFLKEVTFHYSKVFFCGSFARYSSAFSRIHVPTLYAEQRTLIFLYNGILCAAERCRY